MQDANELAEEQMTLQSLAIAVTEQDDGDTVKDVEGSTDEALGALEVSFSALRLPSVGTRSLPIEIVGKFVTPGKGDKVGFGYT